MPQLQSKKSIDNLIRKKIFKVTATTVGSSLALGLVSIVLLSIVLVPSFSILADVLILTLVLIFFCALPLLISRYFLLKSVKPNYADMIKRVKDETSLSAYVLYLTQNFRFPFYIFFFFSLYVSIATMPIMILSIMVLGSLIEAVVKLLIIISTLWIVTIGTHVHITYVKALMGYSGPMPAFRRSSKEKAYLEGLDEAKLYMVIAHDDIEKNNADWIVSFENSLLTLDETFQKRKKIQITNLENIIHGRDRCQAPPRLRCHVAH